MGAGNNEEESRGTGVTTADSTVVSSVVADSITAGSIKAGSIKGELVLEQFLPYRLSVLSNRVSHAIARAYGERFKLTIPAWRVMVILNRYPGSAAADLVEKTAMDKVAISRAVSILLKKGYISRDEHSEDKRRWSLNLSEEGYNIYRQIQPLALFYEQDLLKDFNDEEILLLHKILDRLTICATRWAENGLETEL